MKVLIHILLTHVCLFPLTVSSKKFHGLFYEKQEKKSGLPLRLLNTSAGAGHHDNAGESFDMCGEKVALAKYQLNEDLQSFSEKFSSAIEDIGAQLDSVEHDEGNAICEILCNSGHDSSLMTSTFDGGIVTNLLRAYLTICALWLVAMTFRFRVWQGTPNEKIALYLYFPVMFIKIIVTTIGIIISWHNNERIATLNEDDRTWKQDLYLKASEAIATVSSLAENFELEEAFDSFENIFDKGLSIFDEDQDGDQSGSIPGGISAMIYNTLNQAGEKAEPIIGQLLGTAFHALNQRQGQISSLEDAITGNLSDDSCAKVLIKEYSSEFLAMSDKLQDDMCSVICPI